MVAFRPWLTDDSAANVPLDQIFNLLHLEYGKEEVNALVTKRLSLPLENKVFGREHGLIKRISRSAGGVPQIVTTNFDRLFEVGQEGGHLNVYEPPAFPDLNFGSSIEGITYLHGRLVDEISEKHPYVLSSADFGRAYLSEGWATSFIRHLLQRYTVVLVGYKAEDPPIKYLLQGLNHDGKFDRSKLYAFDRGLPEQIETKWRDRGVTAIAYSNHADLWKSMEAWADRADDPRKWRSSIIAQCWQDPKDRAPHERGQVAHVLRTVQGARIFSEANPIPHPEWICVLDANVRSASPSRSYGNNAEIFDPQTAYGLDDDLRDISEDDHNSGASNDNLLVWREEDDSPHSSHRLGGVFEALPKRLSHIITWVGNSIDDPVLAWWAIRQRGLHPQLLQHIARQVEIAKPLNERARHIWNLILEHHRDPRNHRWNGEWFDLKKRIDAEGWTTSVLREFRSVSEPRLEINLPYGAAQSRPPVVSWEHIHFGDLGRFKLVLLDRHGEELHVPEDVLPTVFGILEEQLIMASGLLNDIETAYFKLPTCYPGREEDGERHSAKTGDMIIWFFALFDRISENSPKLAHAHATIWPAGDQFIFRKLRLYAFNKPGVFQAEDVAEEILSLPQTSFWDLNVARELLFLLLDRWREFSQASRSRLADRILNGPDRLPHWSDEQFPKFRAELSARYARYLEMQGCELSADQTERLAGIIKGVPDWNDGWASSTVTERGSRGGWIRTDETPDSLMDLPVSEVVSRAKEELKHDFDSLTEKRSFTGLVKSYPRKALSALTIAGRSGDFPIVFWSSMISDLPSDVSPRLRRVFLHRVARLPLTVVAELGHTLGRWVEQNLAAVLEFDDDLGWVIYDHIVDGVLSAGVVALKSGVGEVYRGGKLVERSRRTLDHAMNGPIGMCVEGLFRAVPGEKQLAGSLIPGGIKCRVERLLAASGEGADHAISIAGRKLNWLMFVDPDWTLERFIPMLEFDHPASEPAWNGLLHSGRVPSDRLITTIKPLLLRLFPWVEGLSWDRDLSHVAAQWLGWLRIFRQNKKSGISSVEMRVVLRAMSDDTRNQFIFWLGLVGQKNKNGWSQHVIPLLAEVWPRESRYRTTASMSAWITLLHGTGDSFPAVYEAVKKFLVPVEKNDQPFYRFTREVNDEKSITELFPETTLDLINRATPQALSRPSYELPKVLALIAEAEPKLISDPRYLRLVDLMEQS